MQPYTYELAANQSIPITSSGNLVACLDASAPFTVAPDGKYPVDYRQGLTLRFPAPFKGVVVVNGPTAQTITLLLGEGDANVPIPSVVEVVDGAKQTTKDGNAFVVNTGLPLVAANYNHHQLYHDGTDGFLVVDYMHFINETASGTFLVIPYNTELTSVEHYGKNKMLSGDEDTRGLAREQQSTTLLSGSAMFSVGVSANELVTLPMINPIVISPGEGLMVRNQAVNNTTRVIIQYHVDLTP